ncbi:MAG TPA: hypothetical protein PK230_10430, partial [Chitinophagales bacterium]|nr:hypothetical protein [Chitinophagales bacterium]
MTQRKLRYCPNSDVVQLVAADIIFAIHPPEPVAGGGYQTLDWYYSGYTPGNIHSGQYDFASTALHELGHVQALDHVINSTELLHYYSGHGASGAINQLSPDTDILAGTEIINRSADTTLCFKGIKKVGNDCSLPDCADVGCGDAGYPLQAVFQLFPEHCLDNSYYAANSLQGSWYQMVATEVPVVAKDESMGSIVSRQWQIDTDGSPFDNMPCNDLSTMPDTCRSLYWTNPGDKKITLTVTDANGCSASYQEIISVQPECTDNLPIITQSRQICNPVVANCGSSDRNIQLRIARLDGLIGSGCYRYFISYHPTDPTVSTAQEVFTDADLQASDNPNEWQLNCLKAGYYRIQMTDEITACEAEQIIFLNNPEPVYPIIDQYQLQADAGCGACTGSIVLQTVNGNPDLEHYQFAWSVCDPPESCNVVQQNNLCAGAYAVTALDPSTGCSSTSNLSIDYTVPNNDGIVTGINIDVYPTVYTNNTNVRLSLPAAGEVTVEVFN